MAEQAPIVQQVIDSVLWLFAYPVPGTCGTYLTAVLLGGWLFNRGVGGARRMYSKRKLATK